jgi:hypothetical protein
VAVAAGAGLCQQLLLRRARTPYATDEVIQPTKPNTSTKETPALSPAAGPPPAAAAAVAAGPLSSPAYTARIGHSAVQRLLHSGTAFGMPQCAFSSKQRLLWPVLCCVPPFFCLPQASNALQVTIEPSPEAAGLDQSTPPGRLALCKSARFGAALQGPQRQPGSRAPKHQPTPAWDPLACSRAWHTRGLLPATPPQGCTSHKGTRVAWRSCRQVQ